MAMSAARYGAVRSALPIWDRYYGLGFADLGWIATNYSRIIHHLLSSNSSHRAGVGSQFSTAATAFNLRLQTAWNCAQVEC